MNKNMAQDKIFQTLRSLKAIRPDNEFIKRSQRLIFQSPQRPAFSFNFKNIINSSVSLSVSLGLATFMFFVVSGGLMPGSTKSNVTSLHDYNMLKEDRYFNIELAEAQYYDKAAEDIEVALREIINYR